MIDEALVDTDILLKLVSYCLAEAALAELSRRSIPAKVLGAARFMLRAHVAKARHIANRTAAEAELATVTPLLVDIEPTSEETFLAAEIEALAQAAGVPVDGGESQLLAMLMMQGSRLMISGDKRAITAIAGLLTPLPPRRVVCLEQLVGCLVEAKGALPIRAAICAEPAVDKALTSACGCSVENADPGPGLTSYIEALRKRAPALLYPGDRLPAAT